MHLTAHDVAVDSHTTLLWDGTPLTKDGLVAAVQNALFLIGVDTAHYSGYSFWVGCATTAAWAGLR